jgi:branched-chain amino acid transport system permease protein
MATFSTYIALTLIQAGLPYWVAFVVDGRVSFAIGGVRKAVMRPCSTRRC